MERKTKTIFLLVGIFLAGVVSGGLCGGALAEKQYGWVVFRPKPVKPPPRPDWPTRTLDSLQKELSLTAEQRTGIEKFVRDTDEEIRASRKEFMGSVDVRVRSMHDRISVLLNADQKIALTEYQKREEVARAQRNSPSSPPPGPRPAPESGRPASP